MLLSMYMVNIHLLHSRKFDYSTRYIKYNENNVQARKLNEAVGFLVSSLNNLGSRQQIKSKEIQRKKRKAKQSRKNLYFHELCCFINKTKNYFICCSCSRKHIIFFGNADALSNLAMLLIFGRSFQWCRLIFSLTCPCQKLKKPWTGWAPAVKGCIGDTSK